MATELVTYANPGGEANVRSFASGSYVSDGTDLDIICGFVPSKIEVINYDGDYLTLLWFAGMAEGTYFDILSSTGQMTFRATGGFVLLGDTADDTWDGTGGSSNTAGQGFRVPAALLIDTDTGQWIAWR